MDIAIFGAGSIGCYLGAKLSLTGFSTTLICRERIKNTILKNQGITITDYLDNVHKVMPERLVTQATGQSFDVLFVTLKCHQLFDAIDDILALCSDKTSIVFMQNGLGSMKTVEKKLTNKNYFIGITPFNVLQKENAVFHKGTEGHFVFANFPQAEAIKRAFEALGYTCDLHDDMQPVIYGKILLNLNNALNAISDLPIKQQLENRPLRKVLAGAMKEWLTITSHMDVELTQFTAVKPQLIPSILALPNWLFRFAAQKMLDIDPQARSSMWEDITGNRKTEIAFLNGAVVALGDKYKIPTPINWAICDAIRRLERGAPVQIDDFLEETLRHVS